MSHPSKNILLADDDLEDQELLKEVIKELDPSSRIHSVMKGRDIIEYLSECRENALPCLIILDYNMPELNGSQALEILSSNPRYQHIPKLIWSTSNNGEYVNECLRKGALEYFVKPNSMVQLRLMAQKMLSMCSVSN